MFRGLRVLCLSLVWLTMAIPVLGAEHRLLMLGKGMNSTQYPLSSFLCQFLNSPGNTCELQQKIRGLSSFENLQEGHVDLMTSPDYDARKYFFRDPKNYSHKKIQRILTLDAMDLLIFVRKDSTFKTLQDLAKTKMPIVAIEEGDTLFEDFISYFFPKTKIGTTEFTHQAVVDFCENKIDALVFLEGPSSEMVYTVLDACPVRVLYPSKKQLQAFIKSKPNMGLQIHKVDVEQYGGQVSSGETLATPLVLLGSNSLSPFLVGRFVNIMKKKFKELQKKDPFLTGKTPEDSFKAEGIPLHRGVREALLGKIPDEDHPPVAKPAVPPTPGGVPPHFGPHEPMGMHFGAPAPFGAPAAIHPAPAFSIPLPAPFPATPAFPAPAPFPATPAPLAPAPAPLQAPPAFPVPLPTPVPAPAAPKPFPALLPLPESAPIAAPAALPAAVKTNQP